MLSTLYLHCYCRHCPVDGNSQPWVDFLQHYLDDFLTLGLPAFPVCYNNLQACIQMCSKLGLTLHPDKLRGPFNCLSILGIELDSSTLQSWLPPQKRERIIALLDTWVGKRFCTRRELESLFRHLHHACLDNPSEQDLPPSHDQLCTFLCDDHPIRLNQEFQWDLTWWRELFLKLGWPQFLPDVTIGPPTWLPSFAWFPGAWSALQKSHSTAYKEMFPIVAAAHLWGSMDVATGWASMR